MSLLIENWGHASYAETEIKQSKLVDAIAKGNEKERIIFCSHP